MRGAPLQVISTIYSAQRDGSPAARVYLLPVSHAFVFFPSNNAKSHTHCLCAVLIATPLLHPATAVFLSFALLFLARGRRCQWSPIPAD